MEFKIYQDREKIKDTGNVNDDYTILFPQTISEAVVYKNDFTNSNDLKAVLDYIINNKSCVIVSEDEPTNTVGNTHWMKIIGTYNNGVVGNVFLYYVLKHMLRNHDGTTILKNTENVICKLGKEIYPKTNTYDGYLAETPVKITVTETGQVFERFYDEQNYTIHYVLNGGTNSVNNPTSIYHTEEFTLLNASKEHYDFLGWYLDDNFSNRVIKLNKTIDNLTLYAKFEATKYGITYVLNGGTNHASNPNNITYFDNITLSNASKGSDKFEGWYLEAEFVTKVTTLSNISNDITLYAKFADHTHKYTSQITKEATCSSTGTITYTCECGHSYTETIPMKNHNYVDGTCVDCGATQGSSGSGGGINDDITGTVYLYNNGDECINATGGWNDVGTNYENLCSATKYPTYMGIKIISSDTAINAYGEFKMNNCTIPKNKKYTINVKYSLICDDINSCRMNINKFYLDDASYIMESVHAKSIADETILTCSFTEDNTNSSRDTKHRFSIELIADNIVGYGNPNATLNIYEIWIDFE